jgi:hypothetical protein
VCLEFCWYSVLYGVIVIVWMCTCTCRPLTTSELSKHLEDFGIDSHLAQQQIKGFSGILALHYIILYSILIFILRIICFVCPVPKFRVHILNLYCVCVLAFSICRRPKGKVGAGCSNVDDAAYDSTRRAHELPRQRHPGKNRTQKRESSNEIIILYSLT